MAKACKIAGRSETKHSPSSGEPGGRKGAATYTKRPKYAGENEDGQTAGQSRRLWSVSEGCRLRGSWQSLRLHFHAQEETESQGVYKTCSRSQSKEEPQLQGGQVRPLSPKHFRHGFSHTSTGARHDCRPVLNDRLIRSPPQPWEGGVIVLF